MNKGLLCQDRVSFLPVYIFTEDNFKVTEDELFPTLAETH